MAPLRALLAHLRAHAAALLVLAASLAATAVAFLYVRVAVGRQVQVRFDEHVRTAADDVAERMDVYVGVLRAGAGVFAAGLSPSRDEFRRFVAAQRLDRRYPGIQGVGFAPRVPAAALAAHEAAEREDGAPGYHVWPVGERAVYGPIAYLEPEDWRNARALGFDMLSEPRRREAMQRAAATGRPAATTVVRLVQEVDEGTQPGFLVYVPVVRALEPDAASAGEVEGWVYAPFRAHALLQATLPADAVANVRVEIRDGDGDDAPLLYDSGGGGGALRAARTIAVAGRTWTLRFTSDRGFETMWERWLPRWAVLAGLLLAAVLFRLTYGEVEAGLAARRKARRARFLADAGRVLASSLDYVTTVGEVARRAARDQCDWCVILLFEPGGPVRLVGHRDPEDARGLGQALSEIVLDPEATFGAAAARDRPQPLVVRDVDEAALRRIARDPEHAARLRALGLRSIASFALRARGEALGAITFASTGSRVRFGRLHGELLRDLARLVVAAVDTSRLYRRAQEAVRLRDDFLSIASHELKTPLTSLALQADSLRAAAARGQVPESVATKADAIRRNVDRLTRLITNLLDISRISSGRLDLELEPLDLADLAREVTARFGDELARAGCALRLDLEPAAGRWDRLRLDQVLTNLVANAVKYGPGKPIEVAVRARGERATLLVRDHGIGIPRDAQVRIFERFERAVSDRHYGGFGLGLWIVRRIVESLGGTIRVESEPGRGATFTVELLREPTSVPVERGATAR